MERAIANYHPRPYPGSVVLFRAEDRRLTRTYAKALGWNRIARGGVRVIRVPGDHLTMLQEGLVGTLANELCRLLEARPS